MDNGVSLMLPFELFVASDNDKVYTTGGVSYTQRLVKDL